MKTNNKTNKNRPKIVIVDDDVKICQTLQSILIEQGYEVEIVKDVYELIEYLKKEAYYLVILDLVMPEKDGMYVLSAIRCISPKAKLIIYTSSERSDNSIYAYSVDRFLLKSSPVEMLLESIRELMKDN